MGLLDPPALTRVQGDQRYATRGQRRRELPGLNALPTQMASPPTVAALTGSSALTSPKFVAPWEPGTGTDSGSALTPGANFPDTNGLIADTMFSQGTSPSPWERTFVLDSQDATGRFEFLTKANGSKFRLLVLVNGQWQYVTKGPTWTASTGGGGLFGLVTMGAPGTYTLRIEGDANARNWGINLPSALDSLRSVKHPGPRRLFVTDSFGNTITDTGPFGIYEVFPKQFAYMAGGEAIIAGEGGSGWLQTGLGGTNAVQRLTDITKYAPFDEVHWCLGINDRASQDPTAVQAAVLQCLQAMATAQPGVTQFVWGPWWRNGFQTYATNLLAIRDANKAAAASFGATFIDLLSMPPKQATSAPLPANTTLASAPAANANTVSTVGLIPTGYYIQIGTGVNAEIRKVTGTTGTGPYGLQFGVGGGSLQNSHAAGEPVLLAGPGFLTGTGNQGNLKGDGDSDRHVGNDATHPTASGQRNLAIAAFNRYSAAIVS